MWLELAQTVFIVIAALIALDSQMSTCHHGSRSRTIIIQSAAVMEQILSSSWTPSSRVSSPQSVGQDL